MASTQNTGAGAAGSPFCYRVSLNPLDCNLDMVLSPDLLSAHTLSEGGCGYCWSGVRANLGIFARGKFFFRVTLGPPRQVNVHNTATLMTAYGMRAGVSRFQPAVEQLGEEPFSWAVCSTGSKASLPPKPTPTTSPQLPTTNNTNTNGIATTKPNPTAGAAASSADTPSAPATAGGGSLPTSAPASSSSSEDYMSYPVFVPGVLPPAAP
ncbi:hypothetical protein Agub_g8354, partial [Astrephomene gubernaculifera]